MSDWLLLRLPRADTELATWLVVDARGAPLSPPQSGPLALAAARVPGRRVCVLVGGADVLLAEPEVPVKAGAKLQQLVPYALEEHLAKLPEEVSKKTENQQLTTQKPKGGYTSRPNPIRGGIFAVVGATSFLPKAVARAQRAEWFAPAARASAKSRTCLP